MCRGAAAPCGLGQRAVNGPKLPPSPWKRRPCLAAPWRRLDGWAARVAHLVVASVSRRRLPHRSPGRARGPAAPRGGAGKAAGRRQGKPSPTSRHWSPLGAHTLSLNQNGSTCCCERELESRHQSVDKRLESPERAPQRARMQLQGAAPKAEPVAALEEAPIPKTPSISLNCCIGCSTPLIAPTLTEGPLPTLTPLTDASTSPGWSSPASSPLALAMASPPALRRPAAQSRLGGRPSFHDSSGP